MRQRARLAGRQLESDPQATPSSASRSAAQHDLSPRGARLSALRTLAQDGPTAVSQRRSLEAFLTRPQASLGSATGVVQRALNPLDGPKPGRLPDVERGGLDALLGNNGFVAANYAQAHHDTMAAKYQTVLGADDAVERAQGASKRRPRVATLKGHYDTLIALATTHSLNPNSANWADAVQLGVDAYEALPTVDQRNRIQDYQTAGAGVWPGRNAQPAAFWGAIRTTCRLNYGARHADADAVAINAVLAAANALYRTFRGNPLRNRGAWAGSNQVGPQPGDYARTDAATILLMRNRQAGAGGNLGVFWLMQSDTAPSGWALHRGGVDARGDFIYHL